MLWDAYLATKDVLSQLAADRRRPVSVPLVTRSFCFDEADLDQIRAEIWDVGQLADKVGCLYYPREGAETTLVLFAGKMEKFAMLSLARHASCNVMIFQDALSPWYQGSQLLPPIQKIAKFLERMNRSQRLVLFGQSSGAYAALVASKNLKGARVIAVSPQTFSDREAKRSINFAKQLRFATTPDRLIDLRRHLSHASRSTQRALLVSSCEVGNPYHLHFWVDHLHAFRMVSVPRVRIFMLRAIRHSSVFRNASEYAKLIATSLDPERNWFARVQLAIEDISESETNSEFP